MAESTAARPVGRLVGVALAVADLDGAVAAYERLGFLLSDRSRRTEWGIEVATFGFADGSYLELVTPYDRDFEVGGAMATFLERTGDATYLTCFEVDDLSAAYEHVISQGLETLGSPQPAPESTGEKAHMLWLAPRTFGGAFVQLLKLDEGPRSYNQVTPGRRLAGKKFSTERAEALTSAIERLGVAATTRAVPRGDSAGRDSIFIEVADLDAVVSADRRSHATRWLAPPSESPSCDIEFFSASGADVADLI